jgi:beta-phosphoglucomutase-like phosphatase (HAD superfamily)
MSAMPAFGFTAIVFDLDGVIVDTEVPIFDAWRRIFDRHGSELTLEQWNRTVGSAGGAQFVYELLVRSALGQVADRETLRAEVRALQGDIFSTMTPLPGVRDWVVEATALGLGLGVASSSSSNWVRRCLSAVGLDEAFTVISCPDNGLPAKPEPDLYLAACRGLGSLPQETIAIEDSKNGVTAAVAAGLCCLAVPNAITRGADLSAAHHRVDSLAELALSEAAALLSASSATSHG